MSFDFEREFSEAMSEFILNMEQLPPVVDHPAVKGATVRLCGLLRIAHLSAVVVVPPKGPMGKPEVQGMTFFEAGQPDTEDVYLLKKVLGDGSNAEYRVMRRADTPKWTDEERAKIDVFVKTLFVFNGRARVMGVASRLAYQDPDLGINNLNFFIRQCSMMLAKGELKGFTCGRFNLKRFSVINRRFGRQGGTEIMRKYVEGLGKVAGEGSLVCRIGGDNFILAFPNEKTGDVMAYLMEAQIDTGVDGLEKITLCARAGYCPVTDDCRTANEIMDRITSAESIANNNPKLPFVYFDDKTRQRSENAKWVEGLFGEAVENEEFLVYYQPKVNLRDYSLSGAEALCRWKHNGELIPPGRFIPIFEQSNNICVLDFYMLDHICADIRRWLDEGLQVVKVSVNMSRVHLGSEDLAARILEIIRKYNIPNECIEIELTETTTDVDFAELKRVVSALNQEGISTSVDDFGVGYSSLNLIRELPWKVLKIDKSFLPEDIDENSRQKKIMLKYVIAMAQNLGLECIVEGVETIEQVALLKENGCYRAQGFYFDRPLPVEKFEERLRNNC